MAFAGHEKPGPAVNKTSTQRLAGHLSQLDDAALVALLVTREVRGSGIDDFFDLADALLDPRSVQAALSRLDRSTLAVIAATGELTTDARGPSIEKLATHLGTEPAAVETALGTARSLALLQSDGADDSTDDGRPGSEPILWRAYPPVVEQLERWQALGLPTARELASVPAPAALAPVSPADARFIDHGAAERAFASTAAIAALVTELGRGPARELSKGGVALPDLKRLATAMSVEFDAFAGLLSLAARAGLVALENSQWLPTPAAAEWLLSSSVERWGTLAGSWFERLPADIRSLLAARAHSTWGAGLWAYLHWLYPAGEDWMRSRTATAVRDAELLGIASVLGSDLAPSTPGSALLGHGRGAAVEAMAALFPHPVDRVYLQHDLSVVSTGPLEPRLDARLLGMAEVESHGLAARYRVTEASIDRALAGGDTADTIRDFLRGISLSGIPQPLDYLISTSAARYGLVRVGTVAEGGWRSRGTSGGSSEPVALPADALSYISSPDTMLLGAIAVDQNLTPLGIRRVGSELAVCAFSRDVLFWSLNEARYPVAAEDATGAIVVLDQRRVARSGANRRSGAGNDQSGDTAGDLPDETPVAAMVRRLRMAGQLTTAESGRAWLERQVEAAIKGKYALDVTVRMPDGALLDLLLEPAGVGGGRMRGLDRRSDLERTLPLSSIVSLARATTP